MQGFESPESPKQGFVNEYKLLFVKHSVNKLCVVSFAGVCICFVIFAGVCTFVRDLCTLLHVSWFLQVCVLFFVICVRFLYILRNK